MTRGRWVCNVSAVVDRLIARNAARVVAMTVAASMAMSCAAVPAQAGLPEGRVYEMVSPPFKGGYPTFPFVFGGAASLDGEAVDFLSVGVFAGSPSDFALNPYLARRGAGGWTTSPLGQASPNGLWGGPEQVSPDLSHFVYRVAPGDNYSSAEASPSRTFWLSETGGGLFQVSPVLETEGNVALETLLGVAGTSNDFSKLVLLVFGDEPPYHLVAGDEMQEGGALFEAEGPSSPVRLVGVDNNGKAIKRYCTVHLGGLDGAFNAVSSSGAEVFFTTDINAQAPTSCFANTASPAVLFVRVNGAKTLTVSQPLPALCTEEPCKAAANTTPKEAVFQGASEDGSKAFFTTTQPMVNEDKDQSNDLYMAHIGEAGGEPAVTNMVQISYGTRRGESADVQGGVLLSSDGSHVYFVAGGRLTEGFNAQGAEPATGAENLYVYDTMTGETKFIADLCSDARLSGGVRDPQCGANVTSSANDANLWEGGGGEDVEMQTTRDGRFLVFSTYAALAPNDTDTARDVYRYDSETGRLDFVSHGEADYSGDGNDGAFDATIAAHSKFNGAFKDQYELATRAISEDGSTVVFTTSRPLSPRATNGRPDVYEWHDGQVGLISTGASPQADRAPVIAGPLGRDIFFETISGLSPQDTDGQYDIYDARIHGGFPPAPAPRLECSADACQGPLSAAPAPLTPDSVSQQAGGNIPAAKAAPKVKRRTSPTRAQRLARALGACSKKSRAKRARCEAQAQKRYGKKASVKARAHRSSRRGK
jgi:hypothetical protein